MKREEMVLGLRRLEDYIMNMSDDLYDHLLRGREVNTSVLADNWAFGLPTHKGIYNLQLRVHGYDL